MGSSEVSTSYVLTPEEYVRAQTYLSKVKQRLITLYMLLIFITVLGGYIWFFPASRVSVGVIVSVFLFAFFTRTPFFLRLLLQRTYYQHPELHEGTTLTLTLSTLTLQNIHWQRTFTLQDISHISENDLFLFIHSTQSNLNEYSEIYIIPKRALTQENQEALLAWSHQLKVG